MSVADTKFLCESIEARWFRIDSPEYGLETAFETVRFTRWVAPSEVSFIRSITQQDRKKAFGEAEEDGIPGIHEDALTLIQLKNNETLYVVDSLHQLADPQTAAKLQTTQQISGAARLIIAVARQYPGVVQIPNPGSSGLSGRKKTSIKTIATLSLVATVAAAACTITGQVLGFVPAPSPLAHEIDPKPDRASCERILRPGFNQIVPRDYWAVRNLIYTETNDERPTSKSQVEAACPALATADRRDRSSYTHG